MVPQSDLVAYVGCTTECYETIEEAKSRYVGLSQQLINRPSDTPLKMIALLVKSVAKPGCWETIFELRID